jgi:hypothetical protein
VHRHRTHALKGCLLRYASRRVLKEGEEGRGGVFFLPSVVNIADEQDESGACLLAHSDGKPQVRRAAHEAHHCVAC